MTVLTIALPDRIDDQITGKRQITYRWERPDVEVPDKMNDPGLRCVELYVYHYAPRKHYTAMLHIVDVFPGWLQSTIAPGHGLTILTRPVARHSAKALQQFANEAMQVLVDSADDPRVASLYAGHPYQR